MTIGVLSRLLTAKHAVCLLGDQQIICYARGRVRQFSLEERVTNDAGDAQANNPNRLALSALLAHLQAENIGYLTVVLDAPDEVLQYEQTPALYPWEVAQYAQRQSFKRSGQNPILFGYRYVPLTEVRWVRPVHYVLSLFSVPESSALRDHWLLWQNILTQARSITMVAILSLPLVLADYAQQAVLAEQTGWRWWRQRWTPSGQLWLVHWQAGQVKQLLCYAGMVLIQRDILLDLQGADQAQQVADENQLLTRFLQTQPDSLLRTALLAARAQPVLGLEEKVLKTLSSHVNGRSDYLTPSVLAWAQSIRWAGLLGWLGTILVLISLGISVWLNEETSQLAVEIASINALTDRTRLARLSVSSDDALVHTTPEMTEMTAHLTIAPDLLEKRVAWMQDWHRLKMTLNPSQRLSAVAQVVAQFPAIQLTAIAYHNGPSATANTEVLDLAQANLRLTAQIDAQQFAQLAEEAQTIERFVQALKAIDGVAQASVLRNPVLSLQDQAMNLAFAQASDRVQHPLMILLELRPPASW